MAENKIISYDVELLSTNKRREFYIPEVYTNDLYSNEFQFNILDVPVGDLAGATARILLDMRDGSFFNNADVTRSGNTFKYVLKANEGKHYGIAKVQLVVVIGDKDYATPLYNFAVMQGLDDKKANEVVINDLNSETRKEIAKLKSETNTIITDLSAQFQQVIDETTGKDVISAPEIIAARGTHSNLSQRFLSQDQQLAEKSNPLTMIMNDRTEKLLAHRGFSMGAPENTIPAYEWAGKLGYWGSETDIQLTKDGVWILMHDDTLDRMTNGVGSVKDYTLAQIKDFIINAGANIDLYPNLKVPTLKEFLTVCKNYDMVPFIEIKAGTTYANKDYELLISEIRTYGVEGKTVIISFSKEVCTEIRSRNGKIVLFPLLDITQENLNYVKGLKNAGINVYAATVNKAGVELSHSQSVPVACWTANTAVEYATLKEWGVDIVATDVLRHSTKGV